MRSAFLASGFVSTRVGAMTLIGLNTIDLTWGLECNNSAPVNNARAQMESLNSTLATAKYAIISGHVPAGFWSQSCRAQYALIVARYSTVVKQHIFGHLHSDQFFLVARNGSMVAQCGNDSEHTIAIACAPSIVPSFNPSARIWESRLRM